MFCFCQLISQVNRAPKYADKNWSAPPPKVSVVVSCMFGKGSLSPLNLHFPVLTGSPAQEEDEERAAAEFLALMRESSQGFAAVMIDKAAFGYRGFSIAIYQ